eukprot:CAMPEP_0204831746 /NCGR_PEP_ID=MMETSP1346-20131115/11488_1 /ASSEMBLY_ACC=CAM_ASM_000771 /TAXON_ID=215587 /ORGANISM="Aplanochytrium stocchinoi, Strain GSBS06" /LENGTH=280 /DNA_ID=CAMNT_0051963023 /DNA_START=265 /DNA_END=1107 /DNA_ORIENTATION=-
MLYVPCPHPTLSPRKNRSNPKDYEMQYEEIKIKSEDGITDLHGWFIKQRSDELTQTSVTVLYFHGNAGNISDRLQLFRDMWILAGVNIIAVEYRGYGESGGVPSEDGINQDALAFYKFALDHHLIDTNKIIIFGRSLGGAVGSSLALHLQNNYEKQQRPRGLVLENTFTSVPDVAVVLLPILSPISFMLQRPLMRNVWSNKEVIPKLDYPILFVSGLKDEIVPPEQMKTLYSTCRKLPGTKIHTFPHAGHNDVPVVGAFEYYDILSSFLKSLLELEKKAQ